MLCAQIYDASHGTSYFYNHDTGESTWDAPAIFKKGHFFREAALKLLAFSTLSTLASSTISKITSEPGLMDSLKAMSPVKSPQGRSVGSPSSTAAHTQQSPSHSHIPTARSEAVESPRQEAQQQEQFGANGAATDAGVATMGGDTLPGDEESKQHETFAADVAMRDDGSTAMGYDAHVAQDVQSLVR